MSNKPRRATTSDPTQQLLDILYDLSYRLSHHDGDGIDLLERYDYFVRNSERGRACTYALKCKQLFYLSDYDKVKELLIKLTETIRQIPGEENFLK